MMPCPSCAAEVPATARFCPSCGHPVRAVGDEERRIVTVLFADLVGFTSLAEHLDPEQATRLVNRCFERLADDITDFGGRVDKVLGDGILALFGAPIAHEDDPERAVRAALRMQNSLADAMAGTERASGVAAADIRMRIGINTGEVLVGTLTGGDYTAMGDVVNTASRLQTMAPPGRVMVGATTYALTAHTIDYEPAGELTARGRTQTVSAWLAVGASAPPGGRRRHQAEVAMVGRTAEITVCVEAVRAALSDCRAAVVSVTGEGGVGKRRLVTECLAELALVLPERSALVEPEGSEHVGSPGNPAPLEIIDGHCAPYGETNAYWPISNALAVHYAVDATQPAATVRGQIVERAMRLVPDLDRAELARVVDVMLHLHGYPSPLDQLDPTSSRSAVHWGVAKAFERIADLGPVILVIDNMHWAEPPLVDLLEHLVATLARHPFALIVALRPGAELAWPPRNERVSMVSIALQPLSQLQTDELARSLLAGRDVDDGLLADLYDRSGGNPLFLQELAALTGSGATATELPSTLRTMIAARLDQLGPAPRQVLDNAATLGTSGTAGALDAFASAMGQRFDRDTLIELDDLGLLELHGSRWEFRSDSVREAAYQTLTKASRALRHAGVAAALSSNPRLLNNAAVIDELAHHLATAAELDHELGHVAGVPLDIRADAIAALQAAASRALDSGNLSSVIRASTRALDLLAFVEEPLIDDRAAAGRVAEKRDAESRAVKNRAAEGRAAEGVNDGDRAAGAAVDHGSTRAQLLLQRANAGVELHQVDQAESDLHDALAYADAHHDRATQGEAHRLLGSLRHSEARLDLARAELGRAVELLRSIDEPALLAQALRTRGYVELFGGSLVDAEWHFGEADALFRELGDERGMAWVEQHRAWLRFLVGDMEDARTRLLASARTLDELGDRLGVGWVLGLLAFVEFHLCHFDEAERLAVEVSTEAAERHDTWAVAMMLTLQANLRLWRGDLGEGARFAELAIKRFRKINDRYGAAQATAPLLRAQVALGRMSAAQRTEEELVEDDVALRAGPAPLIAVAGAAMHRGDGEAALEHATRAVATIAEAGGLADEPRIILAMALAQLGRVDEAVGVLAELSDGAEDHPFPRSVAAVVRAMHGDAAAAVRDAEWVTGRPEASSYLDRVLAYVGAAGGYARLGDAPSAILNGEAAMAVALAVGDVVAIALAAACCEAVGGRPHPAAESSATLGPGWRTVVDGLVGAATVAG